MLQLIASLLTLLALANFAITAVETRSHPAPGMIVIVNERRMHIQTQGCGQQNVVLLSGLGSSSPVTDFEPLVRALRPDFKVTVVEYFGYGWSDRTSVARTNRNVVEELRVALRKANVLPPYVLVPHSWSGTYTLYYANKHPEEICAIIGLDITVPAQLRYVHSSAWPFIMTAAHATGIVRLALLLNPGLVGYDSPSYTESQRDTIRMMAAWNYGNHTVANEMQCIFANLQEVQDYKFPATIPVSFVLSHDSIKNVGLQMPGIDWLKAHQDLVAGDTRAGIAIVEGGHNVHWRNSEEISKIIRKTVALLPGTDGTIASR